MRAFSQTSMQQGLRMHLMLLQLTLELIRLLFQTTVQMLQSQDLRLVYITSRAMAVG